MKKIRVGIVGYGTIGKRVADAVRLQDDMELVGVTGRTYNWRIRSAHRKGIPIYVMPEHELSGRPGIAIAGTFEELLGKIDIVVDTSPKKIGAEHKEKVYIPRKMKAIFQGGEKPKVADVSFVAQCNYDECRGKQFIRVVSCNTTGLCRTLNLVHKKYGIKEVYATMIRRGADPWDVENGPINGIIPVLEMPSHHGPDVQSVLHDVKIFTTAMSVSTTLMHVHTIIAECVKTPVLDEVIQDFNATSRIRVVYNESKVGSTAEIMELAKDIGYDRGDMPEICIWKEAVGVVGNKLLYMQAIHQESDVVCENIDAIRASMNTMSGEESVRKTNAALRIPERDKIEN